MTTDPAHLDAQLGRYAEPDPKTIVYRPSPDQGLRYLALAVTASLVTVLVVPVLVVWFGLTLVGVVGATLTHVGVGLVVGWLFHRLCRWVDRRWPTPARRFRS